MSYPYFISEFEFPCGNVGGLTYYAAEDLPENVTAFYTDYTLYYKLYTGSPETIGWSTEYLGAAMYHGDMSTFGDISNVVPCGPTPTINYATWNMAQESFVGVICNSITSYTVYTLSAYTSSPLTIPCFYENTGLTTKFNPGYGDILGYVQYPATNSIYKAAMNTTGDLSGQTACASYYQYLVTQVGQANPNNGCAYLRDVYVYANTNIQENVTKFYTNTGLTNVWIPDSYGYVSYSWTGYPSLVSTSLISNSGGTLTYSGNCMYFPPIPVPYVSPIGFTIQPNSTDLYMARSPIVYRYSGCTIAENIQYFFNLIVGSGDTVNTGNTSIYISIGRKPDTYSGITIDVSNMLRTFIKNNLSYTNNNICYFTGTLLEYSGSSLRSTTTSNWSKAVLGYTEYSGTGTFNKTTSGDYLMNTINKNVPYYYSYYTGSQPYVVNWRYTGTQSTSFTLTYYYINGGAPSTTTQTFNSGTTSIYSIIIAGPTDSGGTSLSNSAVLTFYNCLSAMTSYTFYQDTCNGNNITNVKFLNKYGVWDKFYFRGRADSQLDVTNDTYKFNNVNYQNMTYNQHSGSYHTYNTQGREKLILNTGWINEDKNAQIKEMLLSEYIQIDNLPYIITDKSVKYKTNKWDKLINYTLTFEKAFDEINNII